MATMWARDSGARSTFLTHCRARSIPTWSTPSIPPRSPPVAESSVGNAYSYVRIYLTVRTVRYRQQSSATISRRDFELLAQNPPELATTASDFFFTGGRFSQSHVARRMGARSHSNNCQRPAGVLSWRSERPRLARQRLRHRLDGASSITTVMSVSTTTYARASTLPPCRMLPRNFEQSRSAASASRNSRKCQSDGVPQPPLTLGPLLK